MSFALISVGALLMVRFTVLVIGLCVSSGIVVTVNVYLPASSGISIVYPLTLASLSLILAVIPVVPSVYTVRFKEGLYVSSCVGMIRVESALFTLMFIVFVVFS